MIRISLALLMTLVMVGCAKKKEDEQASTSKATLPDGTDVEINPDRVYSDGVCELDNVLTSTYRKVFVTPNNDKILLWDVVFFDSACDVSQNHVVFGNPITVQLDNFDGSTGTTDSDGDKNPDYDVLVTEEEIKAQPRKADQSTEIYSKEAAAFSLAQIFDFSISLDTPSTSNDKLQVSFSLALLTDDFLVEDASYLKSVYASVLCRLANNSTLRPLFDTNVTKKRLDGVGTYSASVTIPTAQKGIALKSCEVIIDRPYEVTSNSTRSVEIKSAELEVP